MTDREELIEIILRWLKSSRPDDSDIPSVLADTILEWHKKELFKMGNEVPTISLQDLARFHKETELVQKEEE